MLIEGLPLPGRFGTFYTNFAQEYFGDQKNPYPEWNLPVAPGYLTEFYEKEIPMWNYFTDITGNMTRNSDLKIPVTEIPAILAEVPDFTSIRK